jgi:hypothetical protein
MSNPFQGYKVANRQLPDISTIQWATPGHPFSHATEAGQHGMRSEADVEFKPVTTPTKTATKKLQMYEVTVKAALMETDLVTLKTLYLLTKQPGQYQINTKQGQHYYFGENTVDPPATPNNSRWLGSKFKLTISMSERKVDWEGSTKMSKPEYDLILANLGTPGVGTTTVGAALIGTATTVYTDGNFRIPGFDWIMVDGAKVGDFSDAKLDIETEGSKDFKGRTIGEKLKVKASVRMKQTTAADLLGASDGAVGDHTIIMQSTAGEIFKFTNGACTLVPTQHLSDKENYVDLDIEGDVYFNADETAHESIYFNLASNTLELIFETP